MSDAESPATDLSLSKDPRAGTRIGAKIGLFNLNPDIADSEGHADFDWFRL